MNQIYIYATKARVSKTRSTATPKQSSAVDTVSVVPEIIHNERKGIKGSRARERMPVSITESAPESHLVQLAFSRTQQFLANEKTDNSGFQEISNLSL